MKLRDLLQGLEIINTSLDLDTKITSVTYDSRKVTPGSLFVAIKGFVTDGNLYIPMALQKGAVAVVTAVEPKEDIPYVLVRSDRLALALIGANYYGHPAKSMKLIGITGTNGKTTSTLLLKHILEVTRGAKVGLIGTMDNMIGSQSVPAERTTPESLDMQALFAKMRDAGCSHVIMEVSSHAIALERVGGLRFDVEYSCRGRTVAPGNCAPRPAGSVTVDNENYGRYTGEIQIIRSDLKADSRVNVIGCVPENARLIPDLVRGGGQFMLVKP